MHENNNQLVDYDAVLDAKFGKIGNLLTHRSRRESVCFLYRENYRRCSQKS